MNLPIPALTWLRSGSWSGFRSDAVAGLTLAAYLLPAALGDASLANLPPESGLYACLFSGAVFWLFSSSRQTAISVTSAISLLIGSSLGELSGNDPARFAALAAGTALLVALIGFVAWIGRAGVIVTFIPESVMTGFKCGVALFLASTQLPKLLGFPGSHGSFWENGSHLIRHLGETNTASLLLGSGALAILLLGRRLFRNQPVALVVVILGVLLSTLVPMERLGVRLLGTIPQGLPRPGLPSIRWEDINDLLPLAVACFLLGAVETAAIGRMFAAKHRLRFDANQEFLALAAANLAAGFGRGLPVSGGMSQSLVNEGAGARTPLSGAVAAAVLLAVVLFLSGLLRALPQPVLAAIILVAVTGLFQADALRHLWRSSRPEFLIAMAALIGVLGSGLLRGVMIGSVLSLALLLRQAARPHVAVLGRIPGTRRFSDAARHAENEQVPGLLIVRPEASLMYFNVDHVRDAITGQLAAAAVPVRTVILDLSATPRMDLQSAHVLAGLADELTEAGVGIRIVEAHAAVRDLLRAEGLENRMGGIHRHRTVADAVDLPEDPTIPGRL